MQERVVTADPLAGWVRFFSPLFWFREISNDCTQVYRTRFVLRNLITTQLKIRYHRSSLGFFWTLLNPVLMLTVQAIIFSQIVRNIPHYPVYLFAGFIPWQYFAACIDNGSRSMLTAEGLIRKIAAPKIIFPLADVIVCLINMLFAMAALFVLVVLLGNVFGMESLSGVRPTLQLWLIIPGTILLTFFSMGLVLISMSLTTFFRDFLHLIPIFLQAWYFASPIMYKAKDIPALGWIMRLNPLTYFLNFFQYAIFYGPYEGTWPSGDDWLIASLLGVLSLTLGYFIYKKLEHEYIFRL
jgi:ABC-type polysaccharide/polyol phosphate export permease